MYWKLSLNIIKFLNTYLSLANWSSKVQIFKFVIVCPARKLRSGLAPVRGERHKVEKNKTETVKPYQMCLYAFLLQLCVDGWVIQQHIMDLDEPRTGGGLRSHRRWSVTFSNFQLFNIFDFYIFTRCLLSHLQFHLSTPYSLQGQFQRRRIFLWRPPTPSCSSAGLSKHIWRKKLAHISSPRNWSLFPRAWVSIYDVWELFWAPTSNDQMPPQYIGFAEDMMLILFLVCILATLVTVHRATCYRQFQVPPGHHLISSLLPIVPGGET